jgi:hypothetical protein
MTTYKFILIYNVHAKEMKYVFQEWTNRCVISNNLAQSRIGVSTLKLTHPFWQTRVGDAILIVVSFVVPFVVIFGVIVLLYFLIEN